MKKLILVMAVLALLCVVATSASAALYSNEAAFLAQVLPGYYAETFNSLTANGYAPPSFSGGGFSYLAYTSGSFNSVWVNNIGPDKQLATLDPADNLVFDFTSNNVTAVGGYFGITGYPDMNAIPARTVTVTLSNGQSAFYTDTGGELGFLGFTTSGPLITKLTVTGGGPNYGWATADNFTVGAVPEPSSIIALLGGLGSLFVIRRRRA